jgi:hypothetical protein
VTIIIIVALAYLVAGVHFVWRDLRTPTFHQVDYAREYALRGRVSPLIFAVAFWVPAAVFRMRVSSLLLFASLVAAGLYVSSDQFRAFIGGCTALHCGVMIRRYMD